MGSPNELLIPPPPPPVTTLPTGQTPTGIPDTAPVLTPDQQRQANNRAAAKTRKPWLFPNDEFQPYGPNEHDINPPPTFTTAPGKPGGKGGKGAAPGGGRPSLGGGGSGSTSLTAPGTPDSGFETQLQGYISDLMSGKLSPYSDASVAGMKASALSATEGRFQNNKDSIYTDARLRGVFRAGQTGDLVSQARRGADKEYTDQVNQIQQNKAKADYDAKLAGLDRARQWLDSKRDYLLRKESNEIARENGKAQIALGYAQIASQKQLLQMQLDAQNRNRVGPQLITVTGADGTTSQVPDWLLNQLLGGG